MKGSLENLGQKSGFRYIELDWDCSNIFGILRFTGNEVKLSVH